MEVEVAGRLGLGHRAAVQAAPDRVEVGPRARRAAGARAGEDAREHRRIEDGVGDLLGGGEQALGVGVVDDQPVDVVGEAVAAGGVARHRRPGPLRGGEAEGAPDGRGELGAGGAAEQARPRHVARAGLAEVARPVVGRRSADVADLAVAAGEHHQGEPALHDSTSSSTVEPKWPVALSGTSIAWAIVLSSALLLAPATST